MWKNFRNFHHVDCKILAFELTKIHFLALVKTEKLHFIRSHLYEKRFKMVVTLWIPSSRQISYMLENFQIIWNCTIYRKKNCKQKAEEDDSKYQIINNIFMELKMSISTAVML